MKEQKLYDAVYSAMLNSYRVIIDKEDPYDLMEQADREVIFAHHIDEPISIPEIENMITWWEDEEEYEMCAELKHLENEIKRLSRRNKKQSVTHTEV